MDLSRDSFTVPKSVRSDSDATQLFGGSSRLIVQTRSLEENGITTGWLQVTGLIVIRCLSCGRS